MISYFGTSPTQNQDQDNDASQILGSSVEITLHNSFPYTGMQKIYNLHNPIPRVTQGVSFAFIPLSNQWDFSSFYATPSIYSVQ